MLVCGWMAERKRSRLIGGRRAGPPEKWVPKCPNCGGPLTREQNVHGEIDLHRGVVVIPIGWSWTCRRKGCFVEGLTVDLSLYGGDGAP